MEMSREDQELAINSLSARLYSLSDELYKVAHSFNLSAGHEAGVITSVLKNYAARVAKLKERL